MFYKERRISIIGQGKGWEKAPYARESWGSTNILLKRHVSRVIDMNDYSEDRWGKFETEDNKKVMEMCKSEGIPYIGLHNYPLKEVIQALKTDYFTNTIDYMIALAIYEHIHAIHFYGVNMALKSEYEWEMPGVNYWCGRAMGAGIELKVFGKSSTIMRCPDDKLYGYDTPQESLEGR